MKANILITLLSLLSTAPLIQSQPNIPNLDPFWPPGPGNPLQPQRPDRELTAILSQIDTNRIRSTITKLVSFGTRHTLSITNQTDPNRGIAAAREWIASELRSYASSSNGRMIVTTPSYIQPVASRVPFPVEIFDVVATLRGSTEPNRVYVISGHYDTRRSDPLDFQGDAPGANDDASGVAISMELARIMANHQPSATIMFVAVAGEEQGLLGSNFLAETLKNSSMDVQGMLNNDIVGSSTGDDGTRDPNIIRMFTGGIPPTETLSQITSRANIGGENDSPSRELGRFVAEVSQNRVTDMQVQTIWRPDRFLRGGDHLSFIRNGFAAVRFTEPRENFRHQHQDVRVENGVQFGDLIEFVDFDFISRVAKVNGAALWSLANAPSIPRQAVIDTSGLTNNSTLRWSDDNNAASFEVVWRPTDTTFWTHAIPVGKVTSVNLAFSKDNVHFGIRAVGRNGYKSPAAFPFPA